MSVWNRPMWLAMVCALWPGVGLGQELFSETFNDGLAGGRWVIRQDGDNGVPDINVQFTFNYSTLGIAPAPRGTGTTGVKVDANVTGAGGAQAVNLFPNGQSFSGDFSLKFDVWSRVAGDMGNAAEDFLGGINATGARTNWLSIGSTGSDGIFHGATGNGSNTGGFDYVRYIGNTAGDPHVTPLFNNTDPLPQATFPNTAGTPQNQWVVVGIEQINGVVSMRMNGVLFDQFANTSPFISGNIFLGHQDILSTVVGNPDTFSIFDNVTVTRVSRWLPDASASWNLIANWSTVTANVPGTAVYFGNVITAARTVTLPSQQVMGDLIFDSPQSYTLGGPGVITLSSTGGNANIDVRRGSHIISAPVEFATRARINVAQAEDTLTLTQDSIIPASITLNKTGPGTLAMTRARFASLAVLGGTLRIDPTAQNNNPAKTSLIQNLWIAGPTDAPTARLDLANNAMIIDYTDSSPLAAVRQWLRVGLLGGNGVISSSSTGSKRLGFLDNIANTFGSFAGQPVDTTSLLIGYTFSGDANLDGKVDVMDLLRLSNHWLGSGTWMDGDFNYDGMINATDLGLMAINWSAGTIPAIDLSTGELGGPAVPEPATTSVSAAVLAVMGLGFSRRCVR